MADKAFKDFVVVVESTDGTLRTFKPAEFRLAARCPTTLLLPTCVERYNARMKREGIGEHAQIVPRNKR